MNAIANLTLSEHAEVIRALGRRAVADIIEIGRRLIDAKALAGHGNWLPWLEREFGWTDTQLAISCAFMSLPKTETFGI